LPWVSWKETRAEKEFDRRRGLEERVEAYRRLAKRHGKPWGTASGDAERTS